MPGPLDGIRILEFSLVVAGPMSGVLLSDLGADVIKVEPPGGESLRQARAIVPDESKAFQTFNRGKRGIVVDLQQPEGREVIHRLVPTVDVVVVNYRYGVAERVGIDYETLRQLREDLIYVESTGFGTRGELASQGCSDVVAQAYSGIMAGDGKIAEDGAPVAATFGAPADYGTAMATAMGVSSALFHRERTGEGQKINTSLLRTGVWLQSHNVNYDPITDVHFDDVTRAEMEATRKAGGSYPELIKVRQERILTGGLFYGGYAAKDGGVVLGALTRINRDGFREVLGLQEEDSDDPDYDVLDPENQRKMEYWAGVMREKMREHTVAEWIGNLRRGRAAGVAGELPGGDPHGPAGAGRGHLRRPRARQDGSAVVRGAGPGDVEDADRGADGRAAARARHARGAGRRRLLGGRDRGPRRAQRGRRAGLENLEAATGPGPAKRGPGRRWSRG